MSTSAPYKHVHSKLMAIVKENHHKKSGTKKNSGNFQITSSMTQHMWKMHCVICSAVPVSFTSRSVEFGNISLATWIEQPVLSLISFIFEPPLPETIQAKKTNCISRWREKKIIMTINNGLLWTFPARSLIACPFTKTKT